MNGRRCGAQGYNKNCRGSDEPGGTTLALPGALQLLAQGNPQIVDSLAHGFSLPSYAPGPGIPNGFSSTCLRCAFGSDSGATFQSIPVRISSSARSSSICSRN